MRITTALTFWLLTLPLQAKILSPMANTDIKPSGMAPKVFSLALAFRSNDELVDLLCDSKDQCGTFLWSVRPEVEPARLQNDLFVRGQVGLPAFDLTATREVDRSSALLTSLKGFRAGYDKGYVSADGKLLLVVKPKQKVSAFKTFTSFAIAIATLGVGVEDETDNQAVVLVLHTGTNQPCFQTLRGDTGSQIIPQAAISPDGNSIALALGNRIELFDISIACTSRP